MRVAGAAKKRIELVVVETNSSNWQEKEREMGLESVVLRMREYDKASAQRKFVIHALVSEVMW